MAKRKRTKRQTMIYQELCIKRKVEQHESHKKQAWTQVLRLTPLVASVVLHLLKIRWF